jgi:hypothetical protein
LNVLDPSYVSTRLFSTIPGYNDTLTLSHLYPIFRFIVYIIVSWAAAVR